MNPLDWGFRELDLRRNEDGRFPTDPDRNSPSWRAFAEMKRDRARRRKARGYSRKTADSLVQRAERMDGAA